MLADASGGVLPHCKARLTGAERRAAIVNAAFDLFSKRGFRGTTTRELAMAVGVSEPVLYQHFSTKRDLYEAIADRMVQDAVATFSKTIETCRATNDDRVFFTTIGELILRWYLDEPAHIRLLLFSALEGHDLADIWHERATLEFVKFVEDYIRRRVAEGKMSPVNPEVAARTFIGSVGHYGLVSVIFKSPLPGATPPEVLQQMVDLFLRSLRPEEGCVRAS